MKVVVVGLGSMGRRRIRLIHKYDESIQIFGVDLSEERRLNCTKEFDMETFGDLAELIASKRIDCAFICTAPLSHNRIIHQCLEAGINIFTELNLVADGYDTNTALAKQKSAVIFLSSTFLYREEIKKIDELVKEADCMLNYTYHIGQYLPDWHPWENYKDFFVGDRRTNGCREIFAIELPWLTEVFGKIEQVQVVKSKMSSLNIDYDDNYLILLQHKSGHKGSLAVDVVSRKAVRNMEIFGEQLYIHWNGTPTGLNIYDYNRKKDININLYSEVEHLNDYSSFIIENAYFNEINAFFQTVLKGDIPVYNFEKDKEVLKIIDRIEA